MQRKKERTQLCPQLAISTFQTHPSALEACVREELNLTAPRMMTVLDPLPVVLENWPAGKVVRDRAVFGPA